MIVMDSSTRIGTPLTLTFYRNEGVMMQGFSHERFPFTPTGTGNTRFVLSKMEYRPEGYAEGSFECEVSVGNNKKAVITDGKFRVKIR